MYLCTQDLLSNKNKTYLPKPQLIRHCNFILTHRTWQTSAIYSFAIQIQKETSGLPHCEAAQIVNKTLNDMREFYIELTLIRQIATVPSSICLLVHIYKFFGSGNISTHRLATKNLTFYCLLLLLNNIFFFFGCANTIELLPEWLYGFVIHGAIYTEYSVTLFKLIMAVDICLSFRKIAVFLQRPPPASSQNKKFYFYCFLGTSIPLFHVLLTQLYFGSYTPANIFFNHFFVMSTIRACRLIPIAGAFWYIRLASIDKTELWSKFSLHMRLLVMLGGSAAVFGVIQMYLWIKSYFIEYYSSEGQNVDIMYINLKFLQRAGNVLEAIIIAILFTFKKDTFKPTHTSASC